MKTRIALNWLLGLVVFVSAISADLARGQNQALPVSAPASLPSASVPPPSVLLPTSQAAPSSLGSAPDAATRDDARRDVPLPSTPKVSKSLADFVRVTQTGVGESGLLSFVNTEANTFDLGADQIIFLQKLGIPSRVIIAMLQHDADVLSGWRPAPPLTLVESKGPIAPAALASNEALRTESKQTDSAPRQPPPQANPLTIALSNPSELESHAPDVIEPATPFDPDEAEQEEEPELYPVRKPYPVKLSDPIIVFKMPMPAPNLVVIYPLR